jgi:L-fuculose-phosphate aldolase
MGKVRMRFRTEREALAEASRRVAAAGLVVGTAGNLSLRVPGGLDGEDVVVVTPTGGVLADLTPEMMSVIDLDGAMVDGDLAPTSEVPLHLSVYQSTGAVAIAHAHALASTAISCTCDELPAIHYTVLQLGGAIRVAPYATFGTDELAANVTKALDGRVAALMQNHGSVAYGSDIREACDRLELLEWQAELYCRAVALGTPRRHTDEELEAVVLAALNRGYGPTRRAEPAPGEGTA